MEIAAFFGMATKYSEGLLAIKYRKVDSEGHILGGPFYYIEDGLGKNWKWLGKLVCSFRNVRRSYGYWYVYADKRYYIGCKRIL